MIFRALIAHSENYQETLNIAAPDFELARRAVAIGHPGATLLWLWPVTLATTPSVGIDHDHDSDLLDLSNLS
ncbi:hypothetical protein [Paraburkholderia sp. J12]|uniref:hypothetical protein n=1 Tax=Paraburkholderia sp. J12 TaxID=2805432 RepID=UPI002ABDD15B|nr:hypothetical protein [Paraburkholderia sp. J12]